MKNDDEVCIQSLSSIFIAVHTTTILYKYVVEWNYFPPHFSSIHKILRRRRGVDIWRERNWCRKRGSKTNTKTEPFHNGAKLFIKSNLNFHNPLWFYKVFPRFLFLSNFRKSFLKSKGFTNLNATWKKSIWPHCGVLPFAQVLMGHFLVVFMDVTDTEHVLIFQKALERKGEIWHKNSRAKSGF